VTVNTAETTVLFSGQQNRHAGTVVRTRADVWLSAECSGQPRAGAIGCVF